MGGGSSIGFDFGHIMEMIAHLLSAFGSSM